MLTGNILRACALGVSLALLTLPAAAQDSAVQDSASQDPAAVARIPASVEGTWRTQTGTEINVQPCGSEFCGTFSFIPIPGKDAEICRGMAKTDFATLILDYKNPNKSLQSRSLLGLNAVSIKPTDDPNAYLANIYNAEEGKSYDVIFWVNGSTLTLGAGCLGAMCAVKQDWPRVPDRADAPTFSCGGV
jgi:uncharacterized protein (DUF2147 family)